MDNIIKMLVTVSGIFLVLYVVNYGTANLNATNYGNYVKTHTVSVYNKLMQ